MKLDFLKEFANILISSFKSGNSLIRKTNFKTLHVRKYLLMLISSRCRPMKAAMMVVNSNKFHKIPSFFFTMIFITNRIRNNPWQISSKIIKTVCASELRVEPCPMVTIRKMINNNKYRKWKILFSIFSMKE